MYKEDGTRAATAEEILEVEAARYKTLWQASDTPPKIRSSGNRPCPKLSIDLMRRTSASFKRRTGIAADGWHPRHFRLLSDEALTVLADLLEILETRNFAGCVTR